MTAPRALSPQPGAPPGWAQAPLKVFPQIWQKWGRPSWWRLATCLSRGPFSVKRCSQNSQLKGLSPVWVRLCLSRLAAGMR